MSFLPVFNNKTYLKILKAYETGLDTLDFYVNSEGLDEGFDYLWSDYLNIKKREGHYKFLSLILFERENQ